MTKKKKPVEKKKKDTKLKVNTDVLKLVTDINKKFGNNAVRTGQQVVEEDYGEEGNIPRIATGNVSLDIDLGGGIPIGRFTQFSGGFSTTKSTQCWHVIANALNMGLVCAVFDAEGTNTNKHGDPDFNYLENFGITKDHYDSGQLIMIRPDSLEECTEICLKLQRSGHVHLALIDSIAVLEPMKVLDSAMDETVQMGLKQKLLGEFFSKYQLANNRLVREGKDGFTLICINQLREKISAYGDPEYEPGGRALGFTLSVNIRLRQGDLIKDSTTKEIVGQVVKYKISKNKTGMRMISGEFDCYLDENTIGVPKFHSDNVKSIIIEGVNYDFIQKGGAWYYLNKGTKDELKFQGLDKLVDYIRENPHWIDTIKEKVMLAINSEEVIENGEEE